MKKALYTFAIGAAAWGVAAESFGQNARYIDRVFAQIDTQTNIQYGTAIPYGATAASPLYLDVYQPHNDTTTQRPVIIAIFGGSFVAGSKEASDIVAWCDSFAHKGYVTVAPSYRLGFNMLQQGSVVRAGYRALQDIRAAVRFLKENATTYGIDTTQIFMVGNSAGSITALQVSYATDANRPTESYGIAGASGQDATDQGCMDCSGNTLAHTIDIKATVGLWGALLDTAMLDTTDHTAAMLVHGTDDTVVPIDIGHAFSNAFAPILYGSRALVSPMNRLGLYNELYVYQGEPHNFYYDGAIFPNAYWDTIRTNATAFFCRFNSYCDTTQLTTSVRSLPTMRPLQLYPNPAHSELNIVFDQPYNVSDVQLAIYNLQGQRINTRTQISEQTAQIDATTLSNGIYIIQIQTPNGQAHQKFVVAR